jgi:hypothetical protein
MSEENVAGSNPAPRSRSGLSVAAEPDDLVEGVPNCMEDRHDSLSDLAQRPKQPRHESKASSGGCPCGEGEGRNPCDAGDGGG